MAKSKINKSKIQAAIKKSNKDDKRSRLSNREVIDWFFDGVPSVDIPFEWNYEKSRIKSTIEYSLIPSFSTIPKAATYFNKHINDLYSSFNISRIACFIKSYIQLNRIDKHFLDFTFRAKSDREQYLAVEREKYSTAEKGSNDLLAEFHMKETGIFGEIKIEKNVIENKGSSPETSEFDKNALEAMKQAQEAKRDKDPRFIKVLSPEIIKKYGLSLIDLRILKDLNAILLIFLDKTNKKKMFMDTFEFQFYISSYPSCIGNDYVVPFDKSFHTPMICYDVKTVERIKQTIRAAFDKLYSNLLK